jgi:hypothetical protein
LKSHNFEKIPGEVKGKYSRIYTTCFLQRRKNTAFMRWKRQLNTKKTEIIACFCNYLK